MSKSVCVVWMNEASVYQQALARVGLADQFEFHGVRADQKIPADLAARCDVLVGWRPAPGVLAGMPRRITSYNVCYTKLLRMRPASPGSCGGAVRVCIFAPT